MFEGGCRCGSARYRLDFAELPPTYACHCSICQRVTGASFAHQMVVNVATLSLVAGETVGVVHMTGVVHHHCGRCMVRLYSLNPKRPEISIVRAGTLDASPSLAPALHIYTSTKQPWIRLPDGVPTFADAPNAEAWAAVTPGP